MAGGRELRYSGIFSFVHTLYEHSTGLRCTHTPLSKVKSSLQQVLARQGRPLVILNDDDVDLVAQIRTCGSGSVQVFNFFPDPFLLELRKGI